SAERRRPARNGTPRFANAARDGRQVCASRRSATPRSGLAKQRCKARAQTCAAGPGSASPALRPPFHSGERSQRGKNPGAEMRRGNEETSAVAKAMADVVTCPPKLQRRRVGCLKSE